MAFTNETTHYGLPQWIGSDKPTYLVDQNNAYQKIDSEIYNANVAAGEAVTTANGASSTAGAASATAADALSAAQTASSTADSALTAAQDARTIAQAAQTAAGAAQTAAEAAQAAAAGNSITNLAPAYDSTIPYAIDDLVTQDGKLYKCIVAVTSPEQFDINKWDDVTCSEVFTSGAEFYTKTESDAKFVVHDNNSFVYMGSATKVYTAINNETYEDLINRLKNDTTFNQIEEDEIAIITAISIAGEAFISLDRHSYSKTDKIQDYHSEDFAVMGGYNDISMSSLRIYPTWNVLSKYTYNNQTSTSSFTNMLQSVASGNASVTFDIFKTL